MSYPRFYIPDALSSGVVCVLPEAVARHAAKVLRLPAGTELRLFDGRGGEYEARIERIYKEVVEVSVGQWFDREVESGCRVTLVQALQAADKMDYTLQKAVELGVAAIQPVESRRSVVKLSGERAVKRVLHWQGVVASACEQSGRNQVPAVFPVQDLRSWLATPVSGQVTRIMLAPGAGVPLTAACQGEPEQIELLVGAEGGLDPVEGDLAQRAGFIPAVLGPRILRTETAGLAALAVIQARWGDFRSGA